MAVWLAHDEYSNGADAHPGKNVISATGLLKATRQLILGNRIPPSESQTDVLDLIASRFGHAVHDSIETAWRVGYRTAMTRLGYPKKTIDKVLINPADDELFAGCIPVYLEQRFFRELEITDTDDNTHKILISGQFDQIINGEINDTKTTSVYAYINRSKAEDYQIQMSIYRWINPTKVTGEVAHIQHVFTDWQRSQARIDKNYPQSKLVEFSVQLLSLGETENWMRNKIREIALNRNRPIGTALRTRGKFGSAIVRSGFGLIGHYALDHVRLA